MQTKFSPNERLKQLIEIKGLKKGVVSTALGWTPQKLSDVLASRWNIKCEEIVAICHILNITPNEFFNMNAQGNAS